jgi:hypothetical protein
LTKGAAFFLRLSGIGVTALGVHGQADLHQRLHQTLTGNVEDGLEYAGIALGCTVLVQAGASYGHGIGAEPLPMSRQQGKFVGSHGQLLFGTIGIGPRQSSRNISV